MSNHQFSTWGILEAEAQWMTRLPIVTLDEGTQAELEVLAKEILSLDESPERWRPLNGKLTHRVSHLRTIGY